LEGIIWAAAHCFSGYMVLVWSHYLILRMKGMNKDDASTFIEKFYYVG
jgi:hypothetical protein